MPCCLVAYNYTAFSLLEPSTVYTAPRFAPTLHLTSSTLYTVCSEFWLTAETIF
uniref:Uncharacterized protein n=1 Tax=Anguilla anguilla TaxID=7936 RepID=A0A0E9WB18_ANGAN